MFDQLYVSFEIEKEVLWNYFEGAEFVTTTNSPDLILSLGNRWMLFYDSVDMFETMAQQNFIVGGMVNQYQVKTNNTS